MPEVTDWAGERCQKLSGYLGNGYPSQVVKPYLSFLLLLVKTRFCRSSNSREPERFPTLFPEIAHINTPIFKGLILSQRSVGDSLGYHNQES